MTPGMTAGSVTREEGLQRRRAAIGRGQFQVGIEAGGARRHRPDHEGQVDDAAGDADRPELAENAGIAEDQHQADARADQRDGERQQQIDLDRLFETHGIFGERDAGQRADGDGDDRADGRDIERAQERVAQVATPARSQRTISATALPAGR